MGPTTYNVGWGNPGWGINGWGGIAPAYDVAGVDGTGSVENVALVINSNIAVSGVDGTGAVGPLTKP